MEWLQKDHVRAFWDNSQEHKDDIRIFVEGRVEDSPYFGGVFDYWVGRNNAQPFCLLMTSTLWPDDELPEIWKAHLSATGKTISIDYLIGNEDFLGKGIAADTLNLFIRFFCAVIDPQADTFLIDPDIDNPKARHVYARAGFISIGRYTVDTGTFKGREKDLMVLKVPGSPVLNETETRKMSCERA